MRFTIRDLLWLTVVVALGVAWWVDHARQREEVNDWKYRAEWSGEVIYGKQFVWPDDWKGPPKDLAKDIELHSSH